MWVEMAEETKAALPNSTKEHRKDEFQFHLRIRKIFLRALSFSRFTPL